jgi:hypothetical protein
MTPQLKKLWDCWIADRTHRRPYWGTWARLLASMPAITDSQEMEPYFGIYRGLIESGRYKSPPTARGKWVLGKWVMRSA